MASRCFQLAASPFRAPLRLQAQSSSARVHSRSCGLKNAPGVLRPPTGRGAEARPSSAPLGRPRSGTPPAPATPLPPSFQPELLTPLHAPVHLLDRTLHAGAADRQP